MNSVISLNGKCWSRIGEQQLVEVFSIFLERESLLSRNTGDPTVDSLRNKKGSCSMRSGLRVGTGFVSFRQTPRGRSFSILGFYTLFKCFSMFWLA